MDSSRTLTYRTLHAAGKLGSFAYFKVAWLNRENVPLEGPVILASNHESYLDPFFITAPLNRKVCWLTLHSTHKTALGWVLDRADCIPVTGPRSASGIKLALERLREGQAIGIFPEGERTTDGRTREFSPLVGLLACRSGAPVVPIRINGAYGLYGRHRRVPRMGRVWVRFGSPIAWDMTSPAPIEGGPLGYKQVLDAAIYTPRDRRTSYEEFTAQIRSAILVS